MSAIGRFRVAQTAEMRWYRASVPCAVRGCARLVSVAKEQRYCAEHSSMASREDAAELAPRRLWANL